MWTLCIILEFLHCALSLKCYECFDGDASAFDCFKPVIDEKRQSFNLPPGTKSCENQRSVFCEGHCSNFTFSGCGYTDLRRYSELT